MIIVLVVFLFLDKYQLYEPFTGGALLFKIQPNDFVIKDDNCLKNF